MTQSHRFVVMAISTAQRTGDRDSPVASPANDHPVALFETIIAERKSAEPIIHMRVNPGLVEQHIRSEVNQNLIQCRFQYLEIMLVPNRIRQCNVAG